MTTVLSIFCTHKQTWYYSCFFLVESQNDLILFQELDVVAIVANDTFCQVVTLFCQRNQTWIRQKTLFWSKKQHPWRIQVVLSQNLWSNILVATKLIAPTKHYILNCFAFLPSHRMKPNLRASSSLAVQILEIQEVCRLNHPLTQPYNNDCPW